MTTIPKPKRPAVSTTVHGFISPDAVAAAAKEKLASSGLTPADAEALGITWHEGQDTTVPRPWEDKKGAARSVPRLALRYLDPWTGAPMQNALGGPFLRFRALGTTLPKYMQETGTGTRAYFPRIGGIDWPAVLSDPTAPLILTEGELKAAKACREGFPTVAVAGVDAFHKAGDPVGLLDDLEAPDEGRQGVAWRGRTVYLCWDCDVATKPGPAASLRSLAGRLRRRGARVLRAPMPDLGDNKTGLDDFLVARGPDALRELLAAAPEMTEVPEIETPEDILAAFGDRYFVAIDGGKTWVISPLHDPAMNRTYYTHIKMYDFRDLYCNRNVLVGWREPKEPDGKKIPVTKPAGDWWLRCPARRTYDGGLIFDPTGTNHPNQFNLWQGFAVKPVKGEWALFRNLMLDVICNGDRSLFDYLYATMARKVQHPELHGEVAQVLIGKKGIGKNTFVEGFLHLFGQHRMIISNPEHAVGKFNDHLRDCAGLAMDEALYAGDKKHEGMLKQIVTSPTLTVERKGQEKIEVRNYILLFIISNDRLVIPASLDERRYCVYNVSNRHFKNFPYFEAIHKELENGGYEAMLYDLQNHDLTGFNHRDVPKTEGLKEQQQLNLPTEYAWWLEVLYRGYVLKPERGVDEAFDEWFDPISTDLLYESYLRFARRRNDRHPLDLGWFGRFMKEMGGEYVRPRRLIVGEGPLGGAVRAEGQKSAYQFGPLEKARAAFCKVTNLAIEWEKEMAEVLPFKAPAKKPSKYGA